MSDAATIAAGLASAEDVRVVLDRAVRAAFAAENAERARGPHALGLSALGGCRRANAYAIAKVDPSEENARDGEGRAATLGTFEHEGLLPRLAAQLEGARTEVPVQLKAAGLTIPGHVDLYHELTGLVDDLKTVGEHRLQGVFRHGPYPPHKLQVRGYALALMQAGLPVRWTAWHYMDRANGKDEVIVEPWRTADGLAVIDRVRQLVVLAERPDKAPRDGRGPGISLACNECWFLRRCWGPDAVPGQIGAQRMLARDNAAIERFARRYDDARQRESVAVEDKKFAKAVLDGAPHGLYGPWAVGHGRLGSTVDMDAIEKRYADLGEVLPTKPTAGAITVKLVAKLGPKGREEFGIPDPPKKAGKG